MSTLSHSPRPSSFIWHKRPSTDPDTREAKRMRYYYVLENESECSSDDGTESIYSVQGKETDYARDTSDTETKSDVSACDIEVEYDIASTSEDEQLYSDDSSTGNEVAVIVAGTVVASIHEDNIMDIWLTEDDDDSESNDVPDSAQLLNKQKCRMCKTQDTMGCLRLCSNCHQIRKMYYPPRPRKHKPKKSTVSQSSMSTDIQNTFRTSEDSDTDKLSSQETISTEFSTQKSMSSGEFLSQRSEISEILHKMESTIFPQRDNSEISTIKSSLTLDVGKKSEESWFEKPGCSKDFVISEAILEKFGEPGTSFALSQNSKMEDEPLQVFSSELLTPSSEIMIQKLRSELKSSEEIKVNTTETMTPESSNLSETSNILKSVDLSTSLDLSRELSHKSVTSKALLVSESASDSGLGSSQEFQQLDLQNSDPSISQTCEYGWSDWALAINEKCIICNIKPKNGIFLHSSDAHLCCCYSCAVKFWAKSKKCAYCNRKVKNVVKAFVV